MSLVGLHAVVTGGGSGIGAAVAQALAAEGARLTLMGRSADRLRLTAERLQARAITADVGDEASVQRAFAEAGPVDILVNNAGQAASAPFMKTEAALWQQMLQVNLSGAFFCSQAVLPGMLERSQGRIVNVASTAALKGYAYVAAYCAAKHGVLGLTRALALELATRGITVNAVCPGYTETDIVAGAVDTIVRKTGRSASEARASLAAVNPQGRLVQPEEVASAVVWLCQPGSGAVTGQAIAVAGGEVM